MANGEIKIIGDMVNVYILRTKGHMGNCKKCCYRKFAMANVER